MLYKTFACALDKAVIWYLRRFLIGQSHHRTDPSELNHLLTEYKDADAETVYQCPPAPEDVRTRKLKIYGSLRCEDISFPSALPSGYPENDTVFVRRYPDVSVEGKSVAIINPGWILGHRNPLLLYFASMLKKNGIITAVVDPPFQMERTPKGCWTGELTISGDLVRTFNSIRQGVSDIRATMAYFRAEGASRIALIGLSMGGWMTALTVTAEEDIDLAIIGEPPVDLDEVFGQSKLVETLREDVRASGIDFEELSELSSLLSPMRYPPKVANERIFLLKSNYDCALPPSGTEALWEKWEKPNIRRYPSGHLSIVLLLRFRKDIKRICREFLEI